MLTPCQGAGTLTGTAGDRALVFVRLAVTLVTNGSAAFPGGLLLPGRTCVIGV